MNIDGWFVDIYTEKNKLSAGQHWVTCVFDKTRGFDKFWSEYIFLSELMPGEAKIYKKKTPPFKLPITKSGAYKVLKVKDPANAQNTYDSGTFYEKDAKRKYETDEQFRSWFNYALKLSIHERILNGLLKLNPTEETYEDNSNCDCTTNDIIDPETGEVLNNTMDISDQEVDTGPGLSF